MSNIEQQLKNFKLELGKEWLALQTHKWRRPKWVKFPRSMLEDARWFNLSPGAKALWIDVLMIAAETADNSLPPTEIFLNRLRILGNHYHISSVSRPIHELIQCGFLTKTTPELQSLRDTEIQSKKGKEGREGESLREGESESFNLSVNSCGQEETEIKRSADEVKIEESKVGPDQPDPIAQPNLSASETSKFVPRASAASTTTPTHFTYAEAQALGLGPIRPRYEKARGRW
jgi:hypothetical protein